MKKIIRISMSLFCLLVISKLESKRRMQDCLASYNLYKLVYFIFSCRFLVFCQLWEDFMAPGLFPTTSNYSKRRYGFSFGRFPIVFQPLITLSFSCHFELFDLFATAWLLSSWTHSSHSLSLSLSLSLSPTSPSSFPTPFPLCIAF